MSAFRRYVNTVDRNRAVIQRERKAGETVQDAYVRCLQAGQLVPSQVVLGLAREAAAEHLMGVDQDDPNAEIGTEYVPKPHTAYGTRKLSNDTTAFPGELHAEASR